MGLLTALQNVPRAGLILFGGIWADRIRRQPFLVGGELFTAALVGSISVAAAFGSLTLTQLFVVALLWGTIEAFTDPAWDAFYPTAVGREHLGDANRILHATAGGLSVVAPATAGALIQVFGAPYVMGVDAASYVVAAGIITKLRVAERPPARSSERRLWTELAEGLRLMWSDRILRMTTLVYTVWHFAGWGMVTTLWVLYLRRVLGLEPVWIGGLGAVGGVILMLAMWASPRVQKRIGFGRLVVVATTSFVVSAFLIPLARGDRVFILSILIAATATGWAGSLVMNVSLQTLRQTVTPDRILGRVSAGSDFIAALFIGAGSLVAGVLAGELGIRTTLWISAFLHPLMLVALARSPIPAMREIPTMSTT
jgi:MFS family permease